ncbi:3-(3-hydroxy-phenyl)propionate/3-hydroxycinnamic acid hydroxylase [Streptomyces fumanus]
MLSLLLAERGRRVTVVERWEAPYTLPRATSFDGETARTLAALGVGDAFAEIGLPADAYDWRNADGATLLRVELARPGAHGWPETTTMHQPALEEALSARARRLPGIEVVRGCTVTELSDDGDRVTVTAADTAGRERRWTASWVVGCDGANSFVRRRLGVRWHDLGFSYDWLLRDVTLDVPREFSPLNVQFCDPARPTTAVERTRPQALGVHAAARGERGRAEPGGDGVAPAGAVRRVPGLHHAAPARRLPLPGGLGRGVAARPGAARGTRPT